MPADQETHALPSPWREFLSELDDMLTQPVELHCIGGFVLTLFSLSSAQSRRSLSTAAWTVNLVNVVGIVLGGFLRGDDAGPITVCTKRIFSAAIESKSVETHF